MNPKLSLAILLAVLALAAGVVAVSADTNSQASGQKPVPPVRPSAPTQPLAPLGSGFTYQGRLIQAGNPANGQYDLVFSLYDASTAGNLVSGPLTMTNQTITGGLFTVQLDFGPSAFTGDARWLEVAARQTGIGNYGTLSPRQPLTAAPYAMSLVPGAVISGSVSDSLLNLNNSVGSGIYFTGTGNGLVVNTSGIANAIYAANTCFCAASYASNSGTGPGMHGVGSSGFGVQGTSTSGYGVYGSTSGGAGSSGIAGAGTAGYGGIFTSTSGTGVNGTSSSGVGVQGTSSTYIGGNFSSSGNTGAVGYSSAANGKGLIGQDDNGSNAIGVLGSSNTGTGIYGASGGQYGVYAYANGTNGYGVYGQANSGSTAAGIAGTSSSGYGGYFTSSAGPGVYGQSSAPSGAGVYGVSNTGALAAGVYGTSSSGYGVIGSSSASNSSGVYGIDNSGSLSSGVYAHSDTGYGLYANSNTGYGLYATSGGQYGVYASATGNNGNGVYGEADNGDFATGVYGTNNGPGYGVYGNNTGGGAGVSGFSSYGAGVVGASTSGYAGYFVGNVWVTGHLTALGGCCAMGAGSTQIDDPLDPANKFLNQSLVESPDMADVDNGHVILDSTGSATVDLPTWFVAMNGDFDYQLTCVGGYAPVFVAQEIKGNQFKIAGGKPGLKVSWQVTGVRHDPVANAYRVPAEQEKPAADKGKYLYPKAYNQPDSKAIDSNKLPQPLPAPKPLQPPHGH